MATTLQPDMVLWSSKAKLAYVVELAVPWEDGVEEAYELAIQAAQNGWKTKILPVEVGCSEIRCYIYDRSIKEDGGERLSPPTSNQILVKCSRKEAAIAFGLKGKTKTGLQD